MTAKLLFTALVAATIAGCSLLPLAGGGTDTDTGGAMVSGAIVTENGQAGKYVRVVLLPAEYNPMTSGAVPDSNIRTTTIQGEFTFPHVKPGRYNIQATSMVNRTCLLESGVEVGAVPVAVPPDTLHEPGAIKVFFPRVSGEVVDYVYIPGSTVLAQRPGDSGWVTIDRVPSGLVPDVYYGEINSGAHIQVLSSLLVPPGDTAAVAYVGWTSSRKLFLNTTSTGAGIAETVTGFPLLVRLTGANFPFNEAMADGADIRFSKADGTALPYEIERFDPSANGTGAAEIWVRVDTVFANDNTRFIVMKWGFPDAVSASNGAAVFDDGNSSVGVWHLGGSGSGPAVDATINGYHGTPSAIAPLSTQGMVGGARLFDGKSTSYEMINTARSRLNFADTGIYSISAWVKTDVVDQMIVDVAAKGEYQYGLQRHWGDWQLSIYHDKTGYTDTRYAATVDTWTYLTGIRSGKRQYLYADGVLCDTIIDTLKASATLDQTKNFFVGRMPDQSKYFFQGTIDEVRVSNAALGASWIKLCYMNQKERDALVVFR